MFTSVTFHYVFPLFTFDSQHFILYVVFVSLFLFTLVFVVTFFNFFIFNSQFFEDVFISSTRFFLFFWIQFLFLIIKQLFLTHLFFLECVLIAREVFGKSL